MNIVDVIILVIIAAFALIGYFRGFVKMIFSLSRKLLAFVGAYLLVGPIRDWLIPQGIGDKMTNYINNWLVNKNETIFTITNPTSDQLASIKESLKIPDFIFESIESIFNNNPSDLTLGKAIASTFMYYAMTVLCFIALFILLQLVVWIVSKILNALMEAPVLKTFNRLFGLIVGISIGLIMVSLCLLLLSGFAKIIDPVNDFVVNYINPTSSSFGLSRWLYNNNLLVILLKQVFHTEDILKFIK